MKLNNEHFLIYVSRVQVKRLHIAMAIGKKGKNRKEQAPALHIDSLAVTVKILLIEIWMRSDAEVNKLADRRGKLSKVLIQRKTEQAEPEAVEAIEVTGWRRTAWAKPYVGCLPPPRNQNQRPAANDSSALSPRSTLSPSSGQPNLARLTWPAKPEQQPRQWTRSNGLPKSQEPALLYFRPRIIKRPHS